MRLTTKGRFAVAAMIDELRANEHHGMTKHKGDGETYGTQVPRCKSDPVGVTALEPLIEAGMPEACSCDLCPCLLRDDQLTPREALVMAIYADAEGNKTRAVERVMGGRVFDDIVSARRKLEAIA